MPLEYCRGAASGEERVVAGRRQQLHRIPSDFLHRVRIDFRAEGFGQQLRTQADAHQRQLRRERLLNPLHIELEERIPLDLVHVHRPAEHDKS